MLENYLEPEQLLSDESFLAWYFKTGAGAEPGKEKDWELWMAAGNGRRELVQQAVNLLDTVRIREDELPAGQAIAAEQALMSRIRISAGTKTPPAKIKSLPARRHWLAAASILVIILSGALVTKMFLTGKSKLKTDYGQIRQQQLPDGTDVVVNANSELSYSSGWKDGVDREVWLNGEAFFHVRKTPMQSRFIVHTDHFDIIVTGTQFNVVNRNGRDNVMLKEGSVMIHTDQGKELKMIPGDFVEYGHDQLEKKWIRNDSLTAWKQQKLEFDKTPISELVRIIKDQYGVTVRLADDSVKDKTISGILRNVNLDVLLQALEATGDFEVVRQNGDIIIGSRLPQ
jgi:transmembrane sensor